MTATASMGSPAIGVTSLVPKATTGWNAGRFVCPTQDTMDTTPVTSKQAFGNASRVSRDFSAGISNKSAFKKNNYQI